MVSKCWLAVSRAQRFSITISVMAMAKTVSMMPEKLAQWSAKLIRITRGSFRRSFEEPSRARHQQKNRFLIALQQFSCRFCCCGCNYRECAKNCCIQWVAVWLGGACGWCTIKMLPHLPFGFRTSAKCHKSKRIKRDMAFGKHFPFCEQLSAYANDIWLRFMRIFFHSAAQPTAVIVMKPSKKIIAKPHMYGYWNALRFLKACACVKSAKNHIGIKFKLKNLSIVWFAIKQMYI